MSGKTLIDPSARIAKGAEIGPGAFVGPNCVVGPDVTIGPGCRLVANVHVTGHTSIGAGTVIYPFASLGTPPQSVKYAGGPTRLVVGANCDVREGVTMNIGTEDDRGVTEVGDRCFLMAGAHVAHDCKVGNDVTFANNTLLGGHCAIGDFVVFGGHTAVRQYVRIGDGAMITGMSGVRADVIPWGIVEGERAMLVGLNVVGMRRRGLSKAAIHRVREAYRSMFFGDGTFRARVDKTAVDFGDDQLVQAIIGFIRSGTRPLTMAAHRVQRDEPD